MSWQAYVDTSLVGTGSLDKAAIWNADGTSEWAASPNFKLSQTELQEIVNAYKDKSDIKQIQSTGVHLLKEKYVVLKADDRSIYVKKGQEGVVVVKTTQAILIAHYPEGIQPGAAANVVEQLADYLIKSGY